MRPFNGDIEPVKRFIGSGLQEQGCSDILELWRRATIEFVADLDREPGIRFEAYLPATEFRSLEEATKASFCDRVSSLASQAFSSFSNVLYNNVEILPLLDDDDTWRGGTARPVMASVDETDRIWEAGKFRLFLSHASASKTRAAALKKLLALANIDLFVAHEDITPNTYWQEQIRLALSSCHAMLFLAEEASNISPWCQQEIGWALGRGIFVTAYSLDAVPPAFQGSQQAWPVPGHRNETIFRKIITMLTEEDRTEAQMRGPILNALASSDKETAARFFLDCAHRLRALNRQQITQLRKLGSGELLSSNKNAQATLRAAIEKFDPAPGPETESGAGEASDPNGAIDFEYDPFSDE